MALVALAALVIAPVACYVNAPAEGREWWHQVGRLVGGVMLAAAVVIAPYLVGFAERPEGQTGPGR
jgi:hypothetical protein